jgi:acyl-CoA thioesterase FadM
VTDAARRDVLDGLTVAYRVRFDESTPEGRVRTSALLRYAQDAAWVHSEALGYDRGWYTERGLWWVVRSVELRLELPIPLGATLHVRTRVGGFRKVWARRRTDLSLDDGSPAGWLHTDWVITDVRGAPQRIPDAFPAAFAAPPGGFEPVRVAATTPGADAVETAFAVLPHQLDPMGHVNNAVYLDHLEDAVAAAGGADDVRALPRIVRLEYLVPAGPGDNLVSRVWRADGGWAYHLATMGGVDVLRGHLSG